MRGAPSPDVKCRFCGLSPAWPTSQTCRGCLSTLRRKGYTWSAEQDEIVRRTYAVSRRAELKDSLNDAVRRLGRSRTTISLRANQLGCAWGTKRFWTQAELKVLRDHLGEWSINAFVKKLNRSHHSVLGAISRLGLSRRIADGYTQKDAAELLGVSDRTVRTWLQTDLLKLRHGRIAESSMQAFVHQHPELYSLKRVDEQWYKSLLFPGAHYFRHIVLKEAA